MISNRTQSLIIIYKKDRDSKCKQIYRIMQRIKQQQQYHQQNKQLKVEVSNGQQKLNEMHQNEKKKYLTLILYNKLKMLIKTLYSDRSAEAVQQFQKTDKFAIIKGTQENKSSESCIEEIFQMTLKSFLRYMKIVGCRIKQKSDKVIVKVNPPEKHQSLNKSLFTGFSNSNSNPLNNMQNLANNDEISLEINLKKNELEFFNIESEAQFKDSHLRQLFRHFRENSLVSQETVFRILMLMNKRKNGKKDLKDKEQKILNLVTEIRDGMSNSEKQIQQCLAFLKNKLEVYQNHTNSGNLGQLSIDNSNSNINILSDFKTQNNVQLNEIKEEVQEGFIKKQDSVKRSSEVDEVKQQKQ